MKVIEADTFLRSAVTGTQGQPSFAEALAVAHDQQAIMRSWASERWDAVRP
ncbi:MAG: hypothetical protein M3R24_16750 [Chloroflexota bacterium]|nr:hypothetical protein [Chloroflexota bacterium]